MAAIMWNSLFRLLEEEMRPCPGRTGFTLRITLCCAVITILSMTLHIPFLAVSLIVVFYTCQPNAVLTAIIGVAFLAVATLAVICALLILKFTFEHPPARLVCSFALFFALIYLLRVVNRVGIAFFPVALVVIYVQTFPGITDQAEIILRLILWAWMAVIYAIGVTVFISFCFPGASPAFQFRQLCLHLLQQVQTVLHCISRRQRPPCLPSLYDVARWQTRLEGLLQLATSASPTIKNHKTVYASHMSAVLRLFNAIAQLRISPLATETEQQQAGRLASTVADYRQRFSGLPVWEKGGLGPPAPVSAHIALDEMGTTLDRLSQGSNVTLPPGEPEREPLLAEDAFSNPVYSLFALKTLLASLICYLFYAGTDWEGIHTIMLSCVIVAQPGLGATLQKSLLRITGAIIGSLLALSAVIFIQPFTDSIVGLLLMTVPVIAISAWIATGSERISYAGTQLAFTFALALTDGFGPVTNLTEIRDRITGILLGVAVSTVLHLYLWPDSELPLLKKQLSRLYRLLAEHIHRGRDIMPGPDIMQTIAGAEMLVNRVALEQLHGTAAGADGGQPAPPAQETLDKAVLIIQQINLCRAGGYPDEPDLDRCAQMLASYADHILSPSLPERQTGVPLPQPSGSSALNALASTIQQLPGWQQPAMTRMRENQ